MQEIYQAPGIITKILTMADNTLRVQIDCQEMNFENEAILIKLRNKYGYFLFKEGEPFAEKDLLNLPDLPPIKKGDKQKTDSQRLRAVLYLLWEQSGKKDLFGNDCDDEIFYHQYMNRIIEHMKSKLKKDD